MNKKNEQPEAVKIERRSGLDRRKFLRIGSPGRRKMDMEKEIL